MPLLGALLAITLSLRDYPATTASDGEISVQAALECAKCSDSYLRAVFFLTSGQYFGYTQNNSAEWVSTTSDKTRYYLVTADEVTGGTWSGQLRVRPDVESSHYSGPGDYSFKLIRYTSSGSKSAESDTVTINITGPTPTLIPATNTPTSVPPSPSKTPSSTPNQPASPAVAATPIQEEVLGVTSNSGRISITPAVINSPVPMPEQAADSPFLPWSIIVAAVVGLLTCIFIYFLPGDILKRR